MTSFTRPGSVLAGSLLLRMRMKAARKLGRVGRRRVLIASWKEGERGRRVWKKREEKEKGRGRW